MKISSIVAKNFGDLHSTLQQFDRESLALSSSSGSASIRPDDIRTWFEPSDHVAFYTPPAVSATAAGTVTYSSLTYRQIHEQMDACPPWPVSDGGPFFVGSLLPTDMMTETAVVHLCIMSGYNTCSAPLDPRSSRRGLLEALDQIGCRGLVTTRAMLEDYDLGFLTSSFEKMDDAKGETRPPHEISELDKDIIRLEQSLAEQIVDVRVIESGQNSDGLRDGSVVWNILRRCQERTKQTPLRQASVTQSSAQLNADPSFPPILLLRTSGTTSTPKLVPLTGPQLLYNARCQVQAMSLNADDITLNSMPLFHIGGMSCAFFSVLVSGGSAIYSGSFDPARFLSQISFGARKPTWYNAVPTMHKTLLLHAKSLPKDARDAVKESNALRFIRSGAAHLSADVATGLKQAFGTKVINSFALSECMPVCVDVQPLKEELECGGAMTAAVSSSPPVGIPVGPSLKVADSETGQALPFGMDGEICISGPGVIAAYLNVPSTKSHTSDGWLRTGDVGHMDKTGVVHITGRAKEMIKRGGEQVWPTMIDNVVQSLEGVDVCVTFAVPNELWGEEVAAAIVLSRNGDNTEEHHEYMRESILRACRERLDASFVPAQVLFVANDQLAKGPSGKYLRTKMALHLNVKAVDIGALQLLERVERLNLQHQTTAEPDHHNIGHNAADECMAVKARADSALDGIRIIASIFIVMFHVGFYPNLGWEKLRDFNISVPIFFILAAFQVTLSVGGDIKWSTFVGTRIGNLQSLFLITQLIALPSLLLFDCAGDETGKCSASFYWKQVLTWFFSTLTGMFGVYNYSNPPSWFLTVIYQFFIIFPFLDRWARRMTKQAQKCLLSCYVVLSTVTSLLIYFAKYPNPSVNKLRWSILAFMPTLFASMLCAYFFIYGFQKRKSLACRWGLLTDATSVLLLVLCVVVVMLSDCTWISPETASALRSEQPLYDVSPWSWMPAKAIFKHRDGYRHQFPAGDTLVKVCGMSYDEFVTYLHDSPTTPTNGRYHSQIGVYIGRLRMGTPIVLLWIYGLAKGRGLTAQILRWTPLTRISPLTYHLYLLHIPSARIYWMVTRPGPVSPQFWYGTATGYGYPFPMQWWEVLILIAICLLLGDVIEHYLTPLVQPYTVGFGVWVCNTLSSFFGPSDQGLELERGQQQQELDDASGTEPLISATVQDLTGIKVTPESRLADLGLDSLGATALLSTLRLATPLAERLSVNHLSRMDTVGEVVDFLDKQADNQDDDKKNVTYHSMTGLDDQDPEIGLSHSTRSVVVESSDDGTVTVCASPNGNHSASVIFCHGLGGTSENFISIAENLAKQLPHVRFILPTASTQPVSIENGANMTSWYDIVGLKNRFQEPCEGIIASTRRLHSLLEEERNQIGFRSNSRMALAGFSQGGALSLFAGMQLEEKEGPLAGIVVCSGYLPAAADFRVSAGLEDTPILHLHGEDDDIIPIEAMAESQKIALDRGARNYQTKTFPSLAHTFSPDEFGDMLQFLCRVLPPLASSNEETEDNVLENRLAGTRTNSSSLHRPNSSGLLQTRVIALFLLVVATIATAVLKSNNVSQPEEMLDPTDIRFNKFDLLEGYPSDPSCSADLPLDQEDYYYNSTGFSNAAKKAQCMLKNYTNAVSVVAADDWECRDIDLTVLISSVGGPPSQPARESNEFWNQFERVIEIQRIRLTRGSDLSRIALPGFPLPYRWADFTVNDVTAAVHDASMYPGSHQAKMIEDLMSGMYGMIEIDTSIVPQRSRVEVLRGIVLLADLNNWAVSRVGPYNFAAKWHVGRARPEEIFAAIQTGSLSVPNHIQNEIAKLRLTARDEDFTAYPEGSPRHPSWPAMNGAVSCLSFWLSVVLNLTPEQHCQVKLLDHALAWGGTVAGVNYEDDNIAGLDMGQEVLARLLPQHLADTYGSDLEAVMAKVERMRFSWREFDLHNPCPNMEPIFYHCDSRASTRCTFHEPPYW